MRVLARITQIDDVRTHPNADLLDLCMIGGWQVVSKRGEFKAGDYALYFEVDSWIPNAVAPFLSKGQPPKEYNGVLGERLRTVRLRGEVSQGLLLPIDSCPAAKAAFHKTRPVIPGVPDEIDVTALLGIQKYEAPIPACLAGKVRGNFPSVFPKTDEERCLSGDTLIVTEHGLIPIQQIVKNKMQCNVLSVNHATNAEEMKPIIGHSVMSRKNGVWLKVVTRSGKELFLTKNHKVWLEHFSCYRDASELVIGDCVTIYSKD